MKQIIISLLILLNSGILAQVVSTIPEFPTENDSIVVFFNASEGDAGLQGYTGDIFSHTGVITNESNGEWTAVIADWNVSSPKTKLTKISEDLYQLNIGYPREYYPIKSSETILKLAFVFKNSDQSKTGRDVGGADIFIDLFEEGLNVRITQPDEDLTFAKVGEQISVTANASLSDTLKLYLDDLLLAKTDSNEISYSLDINGKGRKWLKATAQNGSTIVADSTIIFVRSLPEIAQIPEGVIEGINYINNSTVSLKLFAPDKEFVFVIGDFNNWEVDTSYQMYKAPNDSSFWLTISDLTPQQEYGFQYLVDGNLRIADPYTEKVLDPNDQYISENIYPGLRDYPAAKTKKIVSVLETGKIDYDWSITDFEKPEKSDLVIYEMWIRNFLELHNYDTLIDTLDYLDNLGINAIELMPINEFEGNESWGYNPSFYFAIDKNYGPSNDLKRFIDECHSKGIAVIIDMVINHSYGQSPLVRLYWDFQNNRPAPNNPWYNVQHNFENTEAQWGSDFNHESTFTQKFFDRVYRYWMEEFKVDGFRFDFTKGIGNNFKSNSSDSWGSLYDADRIRLLKRMTDKIWEYNSSEIVIFEHLADNDEEKELANYGIMLWGNMNYNYNEATMGYNADGKSNFSWGYYKNRGWTNPNLVTYMESHDEERLMVKNLLYGNSSGSYSIKDLSVALSRIKLASAFFYTIPGPKMIWQFGELGFDYSINYPDDCRLCLKPFVWDYYNDLDRSNLYKTIQALIKLKTENEVFKSEDVSLSLSGSVKRIQLTHESMNVTVIGNFDVVEKSISPSFQNAGTWYNYFSGDSIEVTDTQILMPLKPGEFHIYTTVKLQTPEPNILVNLDSEDIFIPEEFTLYQNYPNPFNPATKIRYSIPQTVLNSNNVQSVILKVYDVLGREIKTLVNEKQTPGNYSVNFNAGNLSSGIYFYSLSAGNFTETKKMILLR